MSRCSLPLLVGAVLLAAAPSGAQTTAALDTFWDEVSRTVAEGDFEGYGALYHPDAVLVSLDPPSSVPIAEALAGWAPGFADTREGRAAARVEFRFTRRIHDATTAHETGMFRYVFHPRGGEPTPATVHFEALLVRVDGRWRMVMELQKEPATEEEWAAAAGALP
jgi:ketosteroid isomerase-like protein